MNAFQQNHDDPRWGDLKAKLIWRYGVEHARAVLAGKDPGANADLAIWRAIGRKGSAA